MRKHASSHFNSIKLVRFDKIMELKRNMIATEFTGSVIYVQDPMPVSNSSPIIMMQRALI